MSLAKLREWADQYDDMDGAWAAGYDAARTYVKRLLADVTPVVQRMSFNLEDAIPEGWKLYTVDASYLDSYWTHGVPPYLYSVMLRRSFEQQAIWFESDDAFRESHTIYAYGNGATLNEALAAACQNAMEQGTL